MIDPVGLVCDVFVFIVCVVFEIYWPCLVVRKLCDLPHEADDEEDAQP